MKKILELNNVSIKLKKDNKRIVKDVTLAVYEKKVTVIIGESGSGKTMLVRGITGVLNSKNVELKGKCYFQDSDLFLLNSKERRKDINGMALVMQNPMTAFNPSIKIGKQMIEETQVCKKDALILAKEALENVGICRSKDILNAYPFELSGGMLQRVMIAIALTQEARLIIGDEPTTALDVVNQKLVLDELMKLKDKGVSILLVTHDFKVAKAIGDYIVVMKDGEIIEKNNAKEILINPKEDYTKKLLKASFLKRRR